MRITAFVVALAIGELSQGQVAWTSRDLINVPLQFFLPPDSVQGLVPIANGKVGLGEDSVALHELGARYEVWGAPDGVFTYYALGLDSQEDSLFGVLTFAHDRLIEVTFLARGHYYLSSLYHVADRTLGSAGQHGISLRPDSTVERSDGSIVEYGKRPTQRSLYGDKNGVNLSYDEDCRLATARLTMNDAKTSRLMPGWCGNDKRRVSWEKFSAFVRSH